MVAQSVSNYDPYRLTSYDFQGYKSTKSSCITILITLTILVLSFLMVLDGITTPNIQMIQRTGWCYPFTTMPLCVTSDNSNSSAPLSSLTDNFGNKISKKISTSVIQNNYPQLIKAFQGKDFYCYDLIGLSLNQVQIMLQVVSSSAQVYLRSLNIDQIINNGAPSVDQYNIKFKKGITVYANFLKVTLYDQLYLNYQPTVINRIMLNSPNKQSSINSSTMTSIFMLSYKQNTQNSDYSDLPVTQITITIQNIGQIIGGFLSWVSIFSSIVVLLFIVFPFSQIKLEVYQAIESVNIGEVQKPNLAKYYISRFIKGIFAYQDKIYQAAQKMKRLKNILYILRISQTICHIDLKQQQSIEQQTIKSQIKEKEDTQGQNTFSKIDLTVNYSQQQAENQLLSLLSMILRWFDQPLNSISVEYSGCGYGSKKSLIITIIALLSVFVFYTYAGLFTSSNQSSIYEDKSSNYVEFSIKPQNFIITVAGLLQFPIPMSIQCKLVDKNLNTISNITLKNGAQCLNSFNMPDLTKSNVNLSSADKNFVYLIYCLQKPETMFIENQGQQNSLFFEVITPDHTEFTYKMYVKSNQIYLNQIVETAKQYIAKLPSGSIKIIEYKTIKQIINNNVYYNETVLFNPQPSMYGDKFSGLLMKISKDIVYINHSTQSIFNMVSNVWGISMIVFSVILLKFNKFINTKQKNQMLSEEKDRKRGNIPYLIQNISKMMKNTTINTQLSLAKHYLKWRLQE